MSSLADVLRQAKKDVEKSGKAAARKTKKKPKQPPKKFSSFTKQVEKNFEKNLPKKQGDQLKKIQKKAAKNAKFNDLISSHLGLPSKKEGKLQRWNKSLAHFGDKTMAKLLQTQGGVRAINSSVELFDKITHADNDEKTRKLQQSSVLGGLSQVLDDTTRPLHAIASGTDQVVKGKGIGAVGKHALRGAQNKEKTTFSDVLKHGGVNKKIAGPLGFGLDVVADPTTYLSFGTTTVGKAATRKVLAKQLPKAQKKLVAQEAAKKTIGAASTRQADDVARAITKAEKRAAGKGKELTAKQREQIAKQAGARHASPGDFLRKDELRSTKRNPNPNKKGIQLQVGVGSKKLSTTGKTTSRLADVLGVRKASSRAYEAPAVHVPARALNPKARPVELAAKEHRQLRRLEREFRAGAAMHKQEAAAAARMIDKITPGKSYNKIIDAIESGNTKALTAEERSAAKRTSDYLKYLRRKELEAGIPLAKREKYFPHVKKEVAEPGSKKPLQGLFGSSRKTSSIAAGKRRGIDKTLAEMRADGEKMFTENPALAVLHRGLDSAQARGAMPYIRGLQKMGRPIKASDVDAGVKDLAKHEGLGVYAVVRKSGGKVQISKVSSDKELEAAFKDGDKKYFVLPEKVADRASATVSANSDEVSQQLLRGYDRAVGTMKSGLTVINPQHHVTNAMGNEWQMHLAGVSPRSRMQGAKAARASGRASKRMGNPNIKRMKPIKINGREIDPEVLAKEAQQYGAGNFGFHAADLGKHYSEGKEATKELGFGRIASKTGAARKVLRSGPLHPVRSMVKAGEKVDNYGRLATYIEGLKRGMTPHEASDFAAKHLIDYGDLTPVERQFLKRVMPFYTFTSRNVPLQAGALLKNPGKFAQLQKAIEEGQKNSSVDKRYAKDGQPWLKDQLPIPVNVPGLGGVLWQHRAPATDLRRVSLNPKTAKDSFMEMLGPQFKIPVELQTNYNSFFRGPIENEKYPLVAAPQQFGDLPPAVRKKLGITRIVDKKSGKKIWGWPAKQDYLIRQLPLTSTLTQVSSGTDESNRAGQDKQLKLLNLLTGMKFSQYDAKKAKTSKLYERKDRLSRQLGILKQEGKDGTHKYKKLQEEYSKLLSDIEASGGKKTKKKKKRSDGWGTGGSGWDKGGSDWGKSSSGKW